MTIAMARHRIVAELRDRPGVLYRVLGVIRRHGYNIEHLTVIPSEQAGVSRMTAAIAPSTGVTAADATPVIRNLVRLVDVVSAAASPFPRNAPWPSSTTTQMPTYDV